jgi:hypothetical protein
VLDSPKYNIHSRISSLQRFFSPSKITKKNFFYSRTELQVAKLPRTCIGLSRNNQEPDHLREGSQTEQWSSQVVGTGMVGFRERLDFPEARVLY